MVQTMQRWAWGLQFNLLPHDQRAQPLTSQLSFVILSASQIPTVQIVISYCDLCNYKFKSIQEVPSFQSFNKLDLTLKVNNLSISDHITFVWPVNRCVSLPGSADSLHRQSLMTCDIPTLITWSDRLRETDAGAGRGEPRETMYQQGRTQRDGPVGQRGLKQCNVIFFFFFVRRSLLYHIDSC